MECKGIIKEGRFCKVDSNQEYGQFCAFDLSEVCNLSCAALRLSDKQADGLQFIVCARMPQYALAEYIQDKVMDLELFDEQAPFDEESITVDDSE
jgi:hypothetical protein